MKRKRWILILAAVLMLSACSSVKPPATDAPSRSGETLPNKPVETQTSGVPMSSRTAETQPVTEVPESSPVQTEPESSETQPVVPESSEAETSAEPETETREEAFVMPDFYTGKTYMVGRTWYTYEGEDYYVMDPEGHLLDQSKIPERVFDAQTGEVRFYTRTEYARFGTDYEDVTVSTTLYDKDGTVLEEGVPFLFSYACGNVVVRLEDRAALAYEGEFNDYTGDLYDPYAHKVVQEGVCRLIGLNDNSALACSKDGYLMGVVDGSGKALAGFPMETGPYRWPYVYGNGFVFADLDDGSDIYKRVLMNSDLEYMDYVEDNEYYRVFPCGNKGVILAKVLEDGTTYVFDLDKWEILLVTEDSIESMDVQRIICSENESYWLCDWSGKRLAGPYEHLYPIRDNENEDSQGYLGVNGETLFLLDADGKILKTREVPDFSYANPYDGVIYCGYEVYDEKTGYYGYGMLVLDYQLEQMIPDGYEGMRRMAPGIYACPSNTPQGETRITLFNDKGEVIFDNATSVGEGDEEAIPVVKGFSVGLIDLQGNWIAKNNRYQQEPGD